MLLTDSDIICSADLAAIDSEIVSVAKASKPPILIDGSASICEVTWSECQQTIVASMQAYTSFPLSGGGTMAHQSAVNNIGMPARTQPRIRMNQIVTNDTGYSASNSAFKNWMIYRGLSNFYQSASARMEKDRYDKKQKQYRERAGSMWRSLRAAGLPMVYTPLECPGAKHSFNAGPWSVLTNLSGSGSGPNAEVQPVFVAITYYDGSLYVNQANKNNAESGPSQILAFDIPPSMLLTISIAGLNPPNGIPDPVGLALGTWAPLNATNWNVYVGSSPAAMYLQRESLPIATQTFTLPAAPVFSGSTLAQGQNQDSNLCFQRLVMRG
jgi:hypothetical protein